MLVVSPSGVGSTALGRLAVAEIKESLGVPVTSDVHETGEIDRAVEVVDLIQIPAFLCRQTDLLIGAARAGKPINVKKGQFMAPWDMRVLSRRYAPLAWPGPAPCLPSEELASATTTWSPICAPWR